MVVEGLRYLLTQPVSQGHPQLTSPRCHPGKRPWISLAGADQRGRWTPSAAPDKEGGKPVRCSVRSARRAAQRGRGGGSEADSPAWSHQPPPPPPQPWWTLRGGGQLLSQRDHRGQKPSFQLWCRPPRRSHTRHFQKATPRRPSCHTRRRAHACDRPPLQLLAADPPTTAPRSDGEKPLGKSVKRGRALQIHLHSHTE